MYDPDKDYDLWNSGEWVDEEGKSWEPIDLHSVTTLKAFPHITPQDSDFSQYRALGKRANFLKNYGGGLGAIKAQLKLSDEVAQALNRGYYEAFPKVLDYQKWAENQVLINGFAQNLYGRRYYIQNTNFAYKMYNYLIQGSCADLLKENEIKLYEYFSYFDLKSEMKLVVHDEIQFAVKHGEEHIIKDIVNILQDNRDFIPNIPMIVGVEVSQTNWAEKRDIH
jgi:DNA polymerase-1